MNALAGIRVLDLSRLLPGPYATYLLAELGATVDKVEEPDAGDSLRQMPPLVEGSGAAFQRIGRGKRSIAIDLKARAASEVFRRLASTYDVLVDTFRPGVMDRLGIGHETLRQENPRLIVCALTGYGQSGPLARKAGHDLNYLARAGLLGLMGPVDGPPQVPAFQVADVGGALFAVIAILAALRERDRTGQGAALDLAMTDVALCFAPLGFAAIAAAEPGAAGGWPSGLPARGTDVLSGGIAAYHTYTTKDGGFMTLGALEPKFLERFCRAAGIDFDAMALVPGPHQAALKDAFSRVFAERTRSEWERVSEEHDCCLEPVLMPGELQADAHLSARGVFVPNAELRGPLSPNDLSPAPRLGEHSDAILCDAGFAPEEIAKMRVQRILR